MLIRCCATILAIAATTWAGGDDALKQEKDKLKGTWLFASMEAGGKKIDVPGGIKFIFDGDELRVEAKDNKQKGSYRIDASKNPKHVDLNFGQQKLEGLYEFKDGELRVVLGAVTVTKDDKGNATSKPAPRPTKLDSREAGAMLFKREGK